MSDQSQQAPAQPQVVSPALEECPELQVVMYPCVFPKCKLFLDVDLLYVPSLTWINREVGKLRPVTDWFSQATQAEMADFARCKHHAVESAVGQDYNKRHGIDRMVPFRDVLKLAEHKLEQAEFEKEQRADGYRAKHLREKEERATRRLEQKIVGECRRLSGTGMSPQPKRYGDEHRPGATVEPASNKKGKKRKGSDESKKKGGR